MSADDRIMDVVCYGPPDDPHPRHVIRQYTPYGDGWRIMPPSGKALMALAGAPMLDYRDVVWESHGERIELYCRHCRFDEKRRLDRSYGATFPPFSEIFDKLAAAGIWEISARALAARVWSS